LEEERRESILPKKRGEWGVANDLVEREIGEMMDEEEKLREECGSRAEPAALSVLTTQSETAE